MVSLVTCSVLCGIVSLSFLQSHVTCGVILGSRFIGYNIQEYKTLLADPLVL